MIGQDDEATELFGRLLALRNDLGLLSEEYDPRYGRQVGNTPQAFSHVPLIQAALNLDRHAGAHCRTPDGGCAARPAGTANGDRSSPPAPIRATTATRATPPPARRHPDHGRTSWSSTGGRSASRCSSSVPRAPASICWPGR